MAEPDQIKEQSARLEELNRELARRLCDQVAVGKDN